MDMFLFKYSENLNHLKSNTQLPERLGFILEKVFGINDTKKSVYKLSGVDE